MNNIKQRTVKKFYNTVRRITAVALCLHLGMYICNAADTTGIGSRYVEAGAVWYGEPSLSYANPALMLRRSSVSLGSVAAGYALEHQNKALVAGKGKGDTRGEFDARAYIVSGSSSLWGHAGYSFGKLRDLQWCETADYDRVFPYVSADESGGPLKHENYSFSGGYASESGRWSYGASLAYDAGLYYRDTDPRPRDVTGNLRLSGGAAYAISSGYLAGVSVKGERYTQSCDITFQSEVGELEIDHLTGLGTHYVRFDGAGKTTDYKGYTYGGGLFLFPLSGGIFGSVVASRMTMDVIIRDLNKLPMAGLWENRVDMQAGYRSSYGRDSWSVSGYLSASRRHGTENIFGDASASVYPQIASLEMFADNRMSASLRGLYQRRAGRGWLALSPEVGYSHVRQVYAQPFRWAEVNMLNLSLSMSGSARLSDRLCGGFSVSMDYRSRVSGCGISLGDVAPSGVDRELAQVVTADHEAACSSMAAIHAEAELLVSVSRCHAIGVKAGYGYAHYGIGTDAGQLLASLQFYF